MPLIILICVLGLLPLHLHCFNHSEKEMCIVVHRKRLQSCYTLSLIRATLQVYSVLKVDLYVRIFSARCLGQSIKIYINNKASPQIPTSSK